jgi:hypothetical protein
MIIEVREIASMRPAKGLEPWAVNDATIEQFLADLTTKTLVKNLVEIRRRVPRLWNEACTTIADGQDTL